MNPQQTESGYSCWLRHAYIQDASLRAAYQARCSGLVVAGDSPVLQTVRRELAAPNRRMSRTGQAGSA